MNDRDRIFDSIKKALAPLPTRASMPEWQDSFVVSKAAKTYGGLKEQFADTLQVAHGKYFSSTSDLESYLHEENCTFGFCDPTLVNHLSGWKGITVDEEFDRGKVNEYSFGITRADCVVAESGTIVLKDKETAGRLSALAPWIHIAVVEEKDIVPTLPDAIARFGDDPNIIFVTGPSKTADVEGILIEGVHGPGIQVCLVV